MELLIIVLLLFTVFYFIATRKFSHWKIKKVPYLPPLPFFGNAFDVFTFRKNIGEFTRSVYEATTEPYFGFFICDEPYLLIRDPELVKQVLVKDFTIFNDRSICENKRDDPMGSHLLFLLKNPDWREMRRKITPAFTSGKIKNMFQLLNDAGKDLVDFLEKEVEINPIVDIREVSAKYTTDAITSTSFGINANCFKFKDSEFRVVSRRVFNWNIWERAISTTCYFLAPNLVKFFRLKFVDTESASFLRDAFWRTMREREEKKFVRSDLLDILIEMKNDGLELEGDKLVAQATQFFVAGFETTSSTISFTLYELALDKTIQKRLQNEIKNVLGKHGGISYEALKEMEFLDMCVKETLRMYPVLPFLDRRCNSDYQIPGTNVTLERNSPVFISILGLHYDPKYFPEPEKYDPMRFTEDNIETRPQFTYMPFGEGPRNCIGARFADVSSKTGLIQILSKFEVDLCEKTLYPMEFNPRGFLLAPKSAEVCLRFKKCEDF